MPTASKPSSNARAFSVSVSVETGKFMGAGTRGPRKRFCRGDRWPFDAVERSALTSADLNPVAIMSTLIRVAHSPDSDDAFMFYALAENLIDTGDLEFVHELQDIETLNRRALNGELEVTAVSIHAYAYISDRYALLPHGASMGEGYGPRVVAGDPMQPGDLRGRRIAIPGTMTSAYLALRMYMPDFELVVVHFDEIIDYVAARKADAGLIIHEGQLTYGDAGLYLITDLGEWWAGETG